jgi:hypothetical protein
LDDPILKDDVFRGFPPNAFLQTFLERALALDCACAGKSITLGRTGQGAARAYGQARNEQ